MTNENRHPGGETTASAAPISLNDATLLEAAIAYADLGIPIFPLWPRTKAPLTRNGLLDATTDQSIIEEWWRHLPSANIGAVTGVKFDVLDFDYRSTVDGHDAYTSRPAFDLIRATGLMPALLGISRTRHDGLHCMVLPSGRPTTHFASAHVDVLATGGAVLLPPSRVHPDPGVRGRGRYAWVKPLDLDARPLETLFELDRLRDLLAPRPSVQPEHLAPYPAWSRGSSQASLVRFVRASRVGERNRRSFWAMCRAVESGSPLEPLIDAALSCGLPAGEVASVARSARKQAGGGRHV